MTAMRHRNADAQADPSIRRLILFLADGEPHSAEAQANFKRLCDTQAGFRCEVQVVDVFEDYQAALEHGVLVTPCLILVEPPPRVVVAGNLRDIDKVRAALRFDTRESA